MKTNGRPGRLLRWEYTPLLLLLLIVLALHLSTIQKPAGQVFDEQYYVPAASSILQGQGTDRIEQPPLGQLIISAGIRVFGDNPFGWRFLSVVCGLAGIVFFYLICRRLRMPGRYAFLATFILAFENLSFVQSSVAMLDVFSLTCMLASFWLYLRGSHGSSGVAVGLATLCKLTGVLALPVILVHWLVTGMSEKGEASPFVKGRYRGILFLLLAALASFWLLMPLLEFAIWHQWLNPFSQVQFMLKANALATFATASDPGMLARPWDWLVRPEILTFWIDPHYVAMISPTLWALIIPAAGFLVYRIIKPGYLAPVKKVLSRSAGNHSGATMKPGDSYYRIPRASRHNNPALFALTWFAGTCLAWMPFSLITDRISYIYYIYPAIGSVCIALALAAAGLDRIAVRRPGTRAAKVTGLIVPIYLVLCLGAFVILSPVSYWWKLPLSVAAYLLARYYLKPEAVGTPSVIS